MPVTALLIPNTKMEGDSRIKIITNDGPIEGSCSVKMYICDDQWIEQNILETAVQKDTDILEYHVGLRAEAAKKNQFVPQHSTNKEINPEGYEGPEAGTHLYDEEE